MDYPDWTTDDGMRAWRSIALGGILFKGNVEVDGDRSRRIDKQAVKGSNAAKITDGGRELGSFRVTISSGKPEEANANQRALEKLMDMRDSAPLNPIAVENPAINSKGVNMVLIERDSCPKLTGDILTMELTLSEWVPQPKEVKKTAKTETWLQKENREQAKVRNIYVANFSPASTADMRSGRDSDIATNTQQGLY